MSLTIIVPAYNEANAILAGRLEEIHVWCEKQAYESEVLVVDDGSEDDTKRLAQVALAQSSGRVLSIPHAGKAAAIIAGVEASTSEILLFTDMDQATPISFASKLMIAIADGADIAIGSRGFSRHGAPIQRKLMSWGQVLLRYALLGLTLSDTQCGFKAFRRSAANGVLGNLRVYDPAHLRMREGPSVTSGFDVECLMVAQRLGYRIDAVPVNWHFEHTSRVDLRHDALRGASDLFRIAGARWRGAYVGGRDKGVEAALPEEDIGANLGA